MLKKINLLSIGLGVALLMVSCSKDMEDVNPSSTLSGVSTNAVVASAAIGPYTVSDLSVASDGLTWSFTVQRTGDAQRNGLSHLILNLRDCDGNIIHLAEADVAGASVSGAGGDFSLADENLEIEYTEGSGTGCDMADASGFIKYDDLDDVLSDGTEYTFTLELNSVVYVETVDVWVKAGNACYRDEVAGPGCPVEIGCSYSQGQIKTGKADVSGVETITVGTFSYTGPEAVDIMNSNANNGGVKPTFSHVASIKISIALGKLNSTQPITKDLEIAESGLAALGRLNASTGPSGELSSDAKDAADRIGEWIEANNCEIVGGAGAAPAATGKKK